MLYKLARIMYTELYILSESHTRFPINKYIHTFIHSWHTTICTFKPEALCHLPVSSNILNIFFYYFFFFVFLHVVSYIFSELWSSHPYKIYWVYYVINQTLFIQILFIPEVKDFLSSFMHIYIHLAIHFHGRENIVKGCVTWILVPTLAYKLCV